VSWEHPKRPDSCLTTFVNAANAWDLALKPRDTVLEVGCAEADWMSLAAKHQPTARLTGVDVRECSRPGVVIEGDIFDQDFGEEAFDAIVLVSALEHIGLGHYGDIPDPVGDRRFMLMAERWLKPGGWLYADVPWNYSKAWIEGTEYRVYDSISIARLGHGFALESWGYFGKNGKPLTSQAAIEMTGDTDKWVYCANLWRKP